MLNVSLTIDNIPSFDENHLIDQADQCTFTIMWLRNPPNSIIVFGFNERSNEEKSSIDSIRLGVQYQIEGEDLLKRLSHKIEYKCQLTDGCNNGDNFHRVIKSFDMKENFSSNFDDLLSSNSSFNNQSIENCYLEHNRTEDCPPIDYSNCRRCQTNVDYSSSSSMIEVCGTCPEQSSDYNLILYEKIFILTNRSELINRIELTCQNGMFCNSLENIEQIRRLSSIDFDFEKYFSSSSSFVFPSFVYLGFVIQYLV